MIEVGVTNIDGLHQRLRCGDGALDESQQGRLEELLGCTPFRTCIVDEKVSNEEACYLPSAQRAIPMWPVYVGSKKVIAHPSSNRCQADVASNWLTSQPFHGRVTPGERDSLERQKCRVWQPSG